MILFRWRCFRSLICLSAVIVPVLLQAQRGTSGYVAQLHAGQRDLDAHRYTSAISHFRNAISWNASGVEAHLGLGQVYLNLGKEQKAVEQFTLSLRLNPHASAAERGIHLVRTPGQEQLAFQELELEAGRNPDNADLLTTYAEELLERSRLEEAKALANRALKLDPNQSHAYGVLGQIAILESDFKTARKLLQLAVAGDGSDDDALTALGDLEFLDEKSMEAAALYRRVVKLNPDDPEIHEKLAKALSSSGDKSGANKETLIAEKLRKGN